MSYVGSTPTTQNFIAGTDQFTGNGSTTNWTLSRSVNSTSDIQVTIANVVQNPTSYSVSGTTLTVSPAVANGVTMYVRYLSTTLQSITIPPGSSVPGNFGLSGDLQFLGSAQRITGDFSNATVANRVMFQTSTANGNTSISAIPNGTSSTSNLLLVSASDPTNASVFRIQTNGSVNALESSIFGTGTYLPMTFYTSGSERMRIDASGNALVTGGGGLGYGTGSGGTVTQATSKSTAVTLNKPTGQITMNNAALAAGARVSFQVNNSVMAATDTVVCTVYNNLNYSVQTASSNVAGSFYITIKNETGGSLSEAVTLTFAIIKGATS